MDIALFSRIGEGSARARDGLERIEAAEAQGYSGAWLARAEGGSTEAPVLFALAGVAARTTRIELGATLSLSRSAHPLRLAEEIAMLDIMSGGRFRWCAAPPDGARDCDGDRGMDAGIGPGIGPDTGAARFREQLEIVRLALTGLPFSHAGAFFDIPELECLPAPAAQPHPTPAIWLAAPLAGLAAPSLGLRAWTGDRPHAVVVDPLATLEQIESAAGFWRHGLAVVRCVHVGRTDARARDATETALAAGARTGLSPNRHPAALRTAIVGDAAHCRDQVAELRERTGASALFTWHDFAAGARGIAPEDARASQRRFAEEVAPAFA